MAAELSDEMLMAFADGELDAAAMADVARAAAADPAVFRRIGGFGDARRQSRAAFDAELAEPVPARLVAGLMAEPATPTVRWRRAMPAVAAALAIVAAGVGYLIGDFSRPAPGSTLLALGPAERSALDRLLTGEQATLASGQLAVTGSWPVTDGVCRSLTLTPPEQPAVRALACGTAGAWAVEIAFADSASGGFTPASTAGAEALDAMLDQHGATAAVTGEAERALRDTGWGAAAAGGAR